MQITHTDDGKKGHFNAMDKDKAVGILEYVWAGTSKFIIEHTEASPEYKGKGIGKMLVFAAVEFAREKGVKILPLCPFAKALFDKTPELSDILF